MVEVGSNIAVGGLFHAGKNMATLSRQPCEISSLPFEVRSLVLQQHTETKVIYLSPSSVSSSCSPCVEDRCNGTGHNELVVNEYSVLGILGQGRYSTVELVSKAGVQDSFFAMKRFSRHQLLETTLPTFTRDGMVFEDLDLRVQREVDILKRTSSCPSIVRMHEVISNAESVLHIFEYLDGGDLMHWIEVGGCCRQPHWSVGPLRDEHDGSNAAERLCAAGMKQSSRASRLFTAAVSWTVLQQLWAGVSFLHSRGILHKDLKPPNIGLTKPFEAECSYVCEECYHEEVESPPKKAKLEETPHSGKLQLRCKNQGQTFLNAESVSPSLSHVRILDFNTAEVLKEDVSSGDIDFDDTLYGITGTIPFRSPESFSKKYTEDGKMIGYSGRGQDLWALGVTLYCMLFGVYPLGHEVCSSNLSLQLSLISEDVSYPAWFLKAAEENEVARRLHLTLEGLLAKDASRRKMLFQLLE